MARIGGNPEVADRQLKTFYGDVILNIPGDEPIVEDSYKFWRAKFAERFAAPKKRVDHYAMTPDYDLDELRLLQRGVKPADLSRVLAEERRAKSSETKH